MPTTTKTPITYYAAIVNSFPHRKVYTSLSGLIGAITALKPHTGALYRSMKDNGLYTCSDDQSIYIVYSLELIKIKRPPHKGQGFKSSKVG